MIIVTGASGGIGSELIKELSKFDNVICLYNKNKYKFTHENIINYQINLESEKEIKKFTDTIKPQHITIIHLAALYVNKLVINMTLDDLDKQYAVNFRSIFALMKYLLPKMMSYGGHLINFSSPAVSIGQPGTSGYATFKASLEAFTKIIHNEYSKFNIRSNLILLGYYNLGIYKKLPAAVQKKLLNTINEKKLCNVSEISNAIIKLLKTNDSGSVIRLDEGIIK